MMVGLCWKKSSFEKGSMNIHEWASPGVTKVGETVIQKRSIGDRGKSIRTWGKSRVPVSDPYTRRRTRGRLKCVGRWKIYSGTGENVWDKGVERFLMGGL